MDTSVLRRARSALTFGWGGSMSAEKFVSMSANSVLTRDLHDSSRVARSVTAFMNLPEPEEFLRSCLGNANKRSMFLGTLKV